MAASSALVVSPPAPRHEQPTRPPGDRGTARRPRWRARPTAVAVAAVCGTLGAVYLATLLPGVGFSGDTAKFQYVGRVLGTPHQTGYPLYTLLNAAFVRVVPLGSLAWRANLLSALCAVGACALLVPALRRLGCRPAVAAATAATFGLGLTLWSAAVVAEVYALHMLGLVGAFGLLVRWRGTRADRDLGLALAVLGLSLGHHMLTVLALPGVAAFVLLVDRTAWRRPAALRLGALGAALGLASYAYVLWRSQDVGPFTFVQSRATSLPELAGVVRGEEFSGEMLAFPLDDIREVRLPNVARYLREEWSWALWLAPFGLLVRRLAPVHVLLALWAVLDVAFVLTFDVVDVQVFMLPTYLCVAVWVGLGLEALVRRLPGRGLRRVAAGAVAVLLPLAFALWHWERVDASKNVGDARRARAAVAAVPDGSLLVGHDYETTHFLLYDVLGEGVGRARDVGVADEPTPEDVTRHLAGEGDLTVLGGAQERGRPVYAVDASFAEDVEALGATARRVDDALWRLTAVDEG